MLYHRYAIAPDGSLREANLVPPTSRNQTCIEGDLFELGPQLAMLPKKDATALAERAVRNHDPCISCSTHFVRLEVEP